ncbi:MAG: bifunctional metallophosphatase/5'-nucleotidase [Alistipes sp.]|nr:bifunctional metallophosphatase/5'-nucleotidase [Alistipes sp.]
MKKVIALIAIIVALAGALFYRTTLREREVVILSTNDIHAVIDNYPKFVTAVNLCRDTVSTLLVDSGDRWTGNAFIDRAEGRRPIIELMNHAGYDAACLGNHEFDKGAALLQGAIDYASFPTLCANMESQRSDMATPQGSVMLKAKNGVKIFVAGVVTNYDNGHPDGDDAVFEGLTFTDPMAAATAEIAKSEGAHIRLLLSHMGDDKDMQFAADTTAYDIIAGGHTHVVRDTTVCHTVIGQTERRLKLLGATHIRLKGNKITSIDYRNIPLEQYADDSTAVALVARIENDPVLGAQVGTLASKINHTGFANMITRCIAEATDAQIGFYHYGGIRLSRHEAGAVKLATVYNLEPFESKIHTITMTPAQMRAMIIAKFNDTNNSKESHRVDLFSTTPYTIVTDSRGEATDVLFPALREGARYRVALSDYVGKKYKLVCGQNHTKHDILVTDCLFRLFQSHDSVAVDNKSYQKIIKR